MRRVHLADRKLEFSGLNAHHYEVDVAAGEVACTPRRDKVIIYGAGNGKAFAPLEDPEWEVWALNLIPPVDAYGKVRCDRWFDIHQRHAQTQDDLRWISRCPVPIYVPPDLVSAGPLCIRFPLERVEKAHPRAYWACTFAYQIALALTEGFTDIGLYGVDLAYGTMRERTVEWANVSWWVGYAEAKGVTVHSPIGTRLGRHVGRYGVEYDEEKLATDKYVRFMADVDRAHDEIVGMGG